MKGREYLSINRSLGPYVFLWLFLAPLFLFEVASAEVGVSARLNTQSFPVDRVAVLTLTVTGTRSFQEQVQEVQGLRIMSQGRSTQASWVNGAYAVEVSAVYLVQSSKEGNYTIPGIKVQTNQGMLVTSPITFEVTPSRSSVAKVQRQAGALGTTRLRSGEADKVAFLRMSPGKEKSYSGEIIPIEIKLYFRDGIKANLNSLPQLQGDGFTLQELAREPEQSRELVQNIPYTVLTWKSLLSGIKEGEHPLSVEVAATLLLRQRSRRSSRSSMFNDPFAGQSFFDSFFGSYREKEVKIASPVVTFLVRPLPQQGRPADFGGAIGDFRLDVKANPVDVAIGDPITLHMTVRGEGNFERVQAPHLSVEHGLKSYTPSSEFLKDGGPGRGKKVFEQALVAKDASLREIPPFVFSYFDPLAAAYKTLRSQAIPLHIQGQDLVTAPSVVAPPKGPGKLEDVPRVEGPSQGLVPPIPTLAPLQLSSGRMDQALRPLFMARWFQGLALLCILIIGGVMVLRVRDARYARNPRLQRVRAMKELLAVRFEEMERCRTAGDSRGFLVGCRVAIQEQLGLLWEIEAVAITCADLRGRLAADSLLVAVFRDADLSAYGGQELSGPQMEEYAVVLKKELEGLL